MSISINNGSLVFGLISFFKKERKSLKTRNFSTFHLVSEKRTDFFIEVVETLMILDSAFKKLKEIPFSNLEDWIGSVMEMPFISEILYLWSPPFCDFANDGKIENENIEVKRELASFIYNQLFLENSVSR